jgi:hypothetical protein
MPKKGKSKTKEEAQRIKEKSSISQEEANSLERMIDKDKEKNNSPELKIILNEQRMQSEQKTQKSSPSLEKVNAPQRTPTRLEGNITENVIPNSALGGEEDAFNYSAGGNKQGAAKYIKYEGKIIDNIVTRREIDTLTNVNPFERRTFERRAITFESSEKIEISEKNNLEKYSPVKKVDRDKIGKENIFEKKEVKYSPEKY